MPKKNSRSAGGSPKRLKDTVVREREYLTEEEVSSLVIAARKNDDNGARDALMILMAFRHALRASEVVELQWEQLDLEKGTIFVKRLNGGECTTQALTPEELTLLATLTRRSPFIFLGQKGSLFVDTFERIVKRAAERAKIGFPVHPHMLRHGRGFDLARKGAPSECIQLLLGEKIKQVQPSLSREQLEEKVMLTSRL